MEAPLDDRDTNVPVLHPLTPSYQKGRHEVYFDVIEKALAWTGDQTVRNIALTGSYGVGKSSILKQVAAEHAEKLIQVSLSTLGIEQRLDKASQTKPEPADEEDDQVVNPLQETTTNQIQKEIVKQLLYTQKPSRMPGSRYRRTSAFGFGREVFVALVAGVPVAVAFFLFGWTAKLAALFTISSDWSLLANAGMYVFCAALVYAIRFALHNKIRIDSISAGAATITLSATSDTYFDEYLDEIVYFFEVVNADIVIFEDIDRFEDAHIFETLRELNTILNGAKQLNGRTIRFIYAIKDSIFEQLGVRAAKANSASDDEAIVDAATLEVARANRTKFFDLVIPVVPFITHQSARELMADELKDLQHSVSEDLVDLVAQHVADMRLIKNIRNEFVIFRKQVIEKSTLELSDDSLFAMMLYKSTHLSDFELIKLGTSNLDTLYRTSREIVADHTARLNKEIRLARRQMAAANGLATRSEALGAAINEYVTRVLGHVGWSLLGIDFENTPVAKSELDSGAFWRKYAAGTGELSFRFQNPYVGQQRSGLPRAEVEQILGAAVEPDQWDSAARADIQADIEAAQTRVDFLATADMKELLNRDEFTIQRGKYTSLSFAKLAAVVLGSQLARDLLEKGYIDRYFTLYTSTFVGEKVSPNAMNFILKDVDAGTMDIYFTLSPDDARAVIKERRRLALRGRAAYNLDFVDYLLDRDPSGATTVISHLQQFGDDEQQFLHAYFASNHDVNRFAKALSTSWSDVLTFLVDDAELEPGRRRSVMNAALTGLSDRVGYAVSPSLGSYLRGNYTSLEVFKDEATGAATTALIATVLSDADVIIPDLVPLSDVARNAIVEAQQFEVTRINVETAINPAKDMALDQLEASSESVYRRVLSNLAPYVEFLKADEPSVSDENKFVSVLEDVLEADRGSVDAIVARTAPAWKISDLDDISTGTWPALAKHSRFPIEFSNVAAYIDEFGLDENLAVVLQAGQIDVSSGVDDAAKLALAREILDGVGALPSPELRASLLESLEMGQPLDPTLVPKEKGELIGRLIKHGVLADDAQAFVLIGDDWDGLEYAITVSDDFATFVDPNIVTPGLMSRFLASTKVDSKVKKAVIDDLADFAVSGTRDSLTVMGRYALMIGETISWDDVNVLASARVERGVILPLVQRFMSNLTLANLVPILTAIGGDYLTLSTRNGKHPRFEKNATNEVLLNRLQTLGTVKSVTDDGSSLRAHMRKP